MWEAPAALLRRTADIRARRRHRSLAGAGAPGRVALVAFCLSFGGRERLAFAPGAPLKLQSSGLQIGVGLHGGGSGGLGGITPFGLCVSAI